MLTNQISPKTAIADPWEKCLSKIQDKIGPHSYETWFRATDLSISNDGIARVEVPNQFFADFIEEHFSVLVKEILNETGIVFTHLHFAPVQKNWKIVEPISAFETATKPAS